MRLAECQLCGTMLSYPNIARTRWSVECENPEVGQAPNGVKWPQRNGLALGKPCKLVAPFSWRAQGSVTVLIFMTIFGRHSNFSDFNVSLINLYFTPRMT